MLRNPDFSPVSHLSETFLSLESRPRHSKDYHEPLGQNVRSHAEDPSVMVHDANDILGPSLSRESSKELLAPWFGLVVVSVYVQAEDTAPVSTMIQNIIRRWRR